MVPFTTQSIRSRAVIGWRASLLLVEAALYEDEDAPPAESGTTAEAKVPGIIVWAVAAEASKKIEQLSL
jgi:hypothetical protein